MSKTKLKNHPRRYEIEKLMAEIDARFELGKQQEKQLIQLISENTETMKQLMFKLKVLVEV